MSVETPDAPSQGPGNLIRKAIRLVFLSSLMAIQSADTIANEPIQEQEEKNYDDGLYYKGIKKRPDNKPKKKPAEVNNVDDPYCTFNICKHA